MRRTALHFQSPNLVQRRTVERGARRSERGKDSNNLGELCLSATAPSCAHFAALFDSSMSVFDKLTDTSKYTGAHRQRFDGNGRGRGALPAVALIAIETRLYSLLAALARLLDCRHLRGVCSCAPQILIARTHNTGLAGREMTSATNDLSKITRSKGAACYAVKELFCPRPSAL